MRYIEIINDKKFSLLSIFLFIYVILNLLDGERGLISFYEKQKIKNQLINKKESLIVKLNLMERNNRLLTENIELDYLETVFRKNNYASLCSNPKIYFLFNLRGRGIKNVI